MQVIILVPLCSFVGRYLANQIIFVGRIFGRCSTALLPADWWLELGQLVVGEQHLAGVQKRPAMQRPD